MATDNEHRPCVNLQQSVRREQTPSPRYQERTSLAGLRGRVSVHPFHMPNLSMKAVNEVHEHDRY